MLRLQRRDFAHDGDGAALARHGLEVIPQVALHCIETVTTFRDGAIHGFTTNIACAQVTKVDELFLVLDVVIERGVGETQQRGDVLE